MRHNVNVEAQDSEGRSVLMLAVGNNNMDKINMVETILNHNASTNVQDNEGKTALMLAAGNVNSFMDSLLNNVTIDIENNDAKKAMDQAIAQYWTNEKVVRLLLDHGASVELQDKENKTALMFAAGMGNKNIVELLLENHADVDSKDQLGWTPLFFSILKHYSWQDTKIKSIILSHNYTDSIREGNTSILNTLMHWDNAAIIRMLLRHNAMTDIQDARGETPLMYAIRLPEASSEVNQYMKVPMAYIFYIKKYIYTYIPTCTLIKTKGILSNKFR